MVEKWRLVDLGPLDGFEIQSVYEAVAKFVGKGGAPTIGLCYPAHPYVCVGVHQEVLREVDVEYCSKNNIPTVRRRQGGGAVYLDDGQQFYHVIAPGKGMPDVEAFYRKYLQATIHAYRKYGLPAEYRPINDVVIRGRKASGNAAASIEGANVLIGNVIMDLDVERMVATLKAPSEKFRDKLASSMKQWLTSLQRELGYVPEREQVKDYLVEGYERTLGSKLVEGDLTEDEVKEWDRLIEKLKSDEWTYKRAKEHEHLFEFVAGKCTRISEDAQVCEVTYKADKLLRITMEAHGDEIRDVMISGDFFMEPYAALRQLEAELIGARLDREELGKRLEGYFHATGTRLVGAKPDDLIEALMSARMRPHLS